MGIDNIENTVYKDAARRETYRADGIRVAFSINGPRPLQLMLLDRKARKEMVFFLTIEAARKISHRLDVALLRQERRELEERGKNHGQDRASPRG